MNPHDEFNKNIQKLMTLLEKLLKSQKPQQSGADLGELGNKKNVNLNLCIFNFLSMSPEDMEDMEDMLEDMYANGEVFQQHRSPETDLKFELNAKDEDFLKSIGIRF